MPAPTEPHTALPPSRPTIDKSISRRGLPLLSGSPPIVTPTIAPNRAHGTAAMIPNMGAAVPRCTHNESMFAIPIARSPESVFRNTLSPSTEKPWPSSRPVSRLERRTDCGLSALTRATMLLKLEPVCAADGLCAQLRLGRHSASKRTRTAIRACARDTRLGCDHLLQPSLGGNALLL